MDTSSSGSKPACMLADGDFGLLPDKGDAVFHSRLPLPGVVIFVHGVNSDGEWFDSAEEGLCDGLNTRLKRRTLRSEDGKGGEALVNTQQGLMTPAKYTAELTAEGYLDAERSAKNFMSEEPNYSPVIRFRWGYKCNKDELKLWGDKVWLNEFDYWGGGPFANGCSSVPDLWTDGVNDQLFLWITAQHINPAVGRDVYACPSRTYYVLAALRLARLIESIRTKQPDCPITVVCHSQGNVVGVAAAFLADRLNFAADNYILANPPLSLLEKNFTENWTQGGTTGADGSRGRETGAARFGTMKNFLDLLRARAQSQQDAAQVDLAMSGHDAGAAGFSTQADRASFGYNGRTVGRVTLYCNPHDQVISASPIQGIGWRGVSEDERKKIDPAGDVFSQRVFAKNYKVGKPGSQYNYWRHRWNHPHDDKTKVTNYDNFWHPPSPAAAYSFTHGLESSRSAAGKIMTVVGGLFVRFLLAIVKVRINAEPPKKGKDGASDDWTIPINAPELPVHFMPEAMRFGTASTDFDEGYDPSGSYRDKTKTTKAADDPYDQHRDQTKGEHQSDAAMGTRASEAQLRYEDRGRLRMQARRDGMADKNTFEVPGESKDGKPTDRYREWRTQRVADFLKEGIDIPATDHSTIMTNPMHAERAMSYDVAVGLCKLTDSDWRDLRVEADWRYLAGLKSSHPHRNFIKYFETGNMSKDPLHVWVTTNPDAIMPAKIVDHRANKNTPSGLSGDEQ